MSRFHKFIGHFNIPGTDTGHIQITEYGELILHSGHKGELPADWKLFDLLEEIEAGRWVECRADGTFPPIEIGDEMVPIMRMRVGGGGGSSAADAQYFNAGASGAAYVGEHPRCNPSPSTAATPSESGKKASDAQSVDVLYQGSLSPATLYSALILHMVSNATEHVGIYLHRDDLKKSFIKVVGNALDSIRQHSRMRMDEATKLLHGKIEKLEELERFLQEDLSHQKDIVTTLAGNIDEIRKEHRGRVDRMVEEVENWKDSCKSYREEIESIRTAWVKEVSNLKAAMSKATDELKV